MALLCLSAACLPAATFIVTKTADTNGTCNSGVDCSLREAIKAANDEVNHPGADTIVFAAGVTGTINLDINLNGLLSISSNITLQGPGAGLLEVTRATGARDIFGINIGEAFAGPTVNISGIAITNGHATAAFGDNGGGVFSFNSTLTISNCILSGNTADNNGGAVYIQGGTLFMTNCTVTGNTASSAGGGITNVGGVITVKDSTLSFNAASSTASHDATGGAIANGSGAGSSATVINCTLNNNSATTSVSPFLGKGGGIYNIGTLTVRNCTLSGNTADDEGGGIANLGSGLVANATVSNSTLSRNGANSGGGIYNEGASGGNAFVNLDNTILFSTNADPGANLVNVGLGTSITSDGYNLSSDNGGGFLAAAGDQINTDPKLGPLQNNGGPTATMALLANSPAQDKGKNFGVITDQRGLTRPVDVPTIPNASGGDGSDIGAVEMDAAQSGITLVVTTSADHDDGVCSFDDCSLREAVNAANATSGANSIIFNGSVTGAITLQSGLGTLTVTDTLVITGPGARLLTVSGNNAIRVFSFNSGSNTISGLTINAGKVVAAGSGASATGGGVFNASASSLSLADCTFSNNNVQGADSTTASGVGDSGSGGAIGNSGTLTLNRCTLVNNNATGGRGGNSSGAIGDPVRGGDGGAAQGGGIFNDTSATLTINNSTFECGAGGGAGGDGQFGGNGGSASGGIFNLGTMTVTASTFSLNFGIGGAGGQGSNRFNGGSAGAGRGGLTAGGGTSTVRDTISAGNDLGFNGGGTDVDGAFTSQGYNLIGTADHSTGFSATGDQTGTDAALLFAVLGGLTNNGGPTDTMALVTGSPALDRGKNFGLTGDQRGSPRPVDTAFPNASGGDGSDIGAVEMNLLGGADSDGDGMSDDFETFFVLSDPNADADHDGLTNLQEFMAGTNPLDGASWFRVMVVARSANDFVVTFAPAIAGKSYRLERKNALTDANWGSIAGVADLTPVSTGTAQITDPGGASVAKHFYHVRVLP
jgi:CSLREA domain-containing protein